MKKRMVRAAYAADTLFVDLDVQIFKRIDERAGTAHFEVNVYAVAVFGHHGSGNSYRLAFCDLCARFDRSRAERLIYGRYTVIVIYRNYRAFERGYFHRRYRPVGDRVYGGTLACGKINAFSTY